MQTAWPIIFAVFIWWFSTGLILLLDGLPRTTFRWSQLISSALAVMALVGLQQSAGQMDVASVYCAFTCALLVWGWHELSFLTGWVTGPRKIEMEEDAQGWRRFVQATQTLIWHELAILATGVLIVALTWGEPNQVGTATFVVLWLMRISAKLNVFYGVRNLSLQFLPPHLRYLGTYFRKRAMNVFFPFAVSAATAVAVLLARQTLSYPPGSAEAIGGWLVLTMLVLAIVEHWLLVLPLEATALWRWAMHKPSSSQAASVVKPVAPTLDSDDKLLHAR